MATAILTDIEGTTSSLSFVKDVLFPYSREKLPAFVRAHANDPSVQQQLRAVHGEAGKPLDMEASIAQLIAWIDADRKITPLKAIQGMIWENGYRNGDFHGHVYDDAVAFLRRWHDSGIPLYVFSSGSVLAQKLLFAHTAAGDLTRLFSGYFDTTIGSKREPAAYRAIALHIGKPPSEILFLSDIREELDAARAAGMDTCLLDRAGTTTDTGGHPRATRFDEIRL